MKLYQNTKIVIQFLKYEWIGHINAIHDLLIIFDIFHYVENYSIINLSIFSW